MTDHTDTRNGDPDPAATVRAIYRYHAVDRGWGDIGYNYVVDVNGNIFEGRVGGANVIGGQDAPSLGLENTLAQELGRATVQHAQEPEPHGNLECTR